MKHTYEDYLDDMLENARKALDFVQGMKFEDFAEDERTIYAVVRALEVIGEAARQIPDEIRDKNLEIP